MLCYVQKKPPDNNHHHGLHAEQQQQTGGDRKSKNGSGMFAGCGKPGVARTGHCKRCGKFCDGSGTNGAMVVPQRLAAVSSAVLIEVVPIKSFNHGRHGVSEPGHHRAYQRRLHSGIGREPYLQAELCADDHADHVAKRAQVLVGCIAVPRIRRRPVRRDGGWMSVATSSGLN